MTLYRFLPLAVLLALAPAAAGQPGAPALHPNPHAGGVLVVAYDGSGTAAAPSVDVFDVLGRRVPADGVLPAGLYLVRLRWPDGRVSPAARLTQTEPGRLAVVLRPEAPGYHPADAVAAARAGDAAGLTGAADRDCPDLPCDTLPFSGLWNTALGNAALGVLPGGTLEVAGLGTSAEDGLRIDLGNASGVRLDFPAPDYLPVVGQYQWDLDNDGYLDFVENDGIVQATVDFTGMGVTTTQMEAACGDSIVSYEFESVAAFSIADGGTGGVRISSFSWGVSNDSRHERPSLVGDLPIFLADIVLAECELVTVEGVETPADRVSLFVVPGHINIPWSLTGRFPDYPPGAFQLSREWVQAMGHYHSFFGTDTFTYTFDIPEPSGPLGFSCAVAGGCSGDPGVEILAGEGAERLHAELEPVLIPAGGDRFFDVTLTYDDGTDAPAEVTLSMESRPNGTILQMDKDICDEAGGAALDECDVLFEFIRNGQVRFSRTLQAGVPLSLRRGFRVVSAEVMASDGTTGAGVKPAQWEIVVGVQLTAGGNPDLFRFSGTGPTQALLHGMGTVSGLPFTITEEWDCPGAPGCPVQAQPPRVAPAAFDLGGFFGE